MEESDRLSHIVEHQFEHQGHAHGK